MAATKREELEMEIKIVHDVKDELLNRGSGSIRGTLDRRMFRLRKEIAEIDAQIESVPAPVEG